MLTLERLYTVEEFWAYITRPENLTRHFELIGGEIIEMVSDQYASEVAFEIGFQVKLCMKTNDVKGRVTGADGGYMVSGKPYIPDVAFTSLASQPHREQKHGYALYAPDLAVEVESPTDRKENLRIKIADYLNAGTVVWRFKPHDKTVIVYVPKQAPRLLQGDDILDGGDVLPEFSVRVSDLFPDED